MQSLDQMKLNDIRAIFVRKRLTASDRTLQRYRNLSRNQVDEVVKAHHSIGAALGKLIRHHPFYASIALGTEIYCRSDIPTACTNGEELIFNPEWTMQQTEAQLIGVVAHEVEHIALLHPLRLGKRHHKIWNIACDYVINHQLTEQGFTLPDGALFEEKYRGQNAEVVYEDIYKNYRFVTVKEPGTISPKSGGGGGSIPGGSSSGDSNDDDGNDPPSGKQDDTKDDGSESENEGDDGSNGDGDKDDGTPNGPTWGTVIDGNKGLSETDKSRREERVKQQVHQAALHAQALGAGQDAARAERIINEYEDDTNWKDILREFIKTTADRCDFSWSRPNKRYIQSGIYLPRMAGEHLDDVVIAIDTSGSISQGQLDRFGGALSSILSEFETVTIHICYCDTVIHKTETLTKADLPLHLVPVGGGGTSFVPPFEWIEREGIEPSCFMYFTDMMCDSFPSEAPAYDVRWLNFGGRAHFGWQKRQYKQYYKGDFPPFGEVIDMDLPEAV